MNSYNENSLLIGDHAQIVFDKLTSHELKKMINLSKKMREQIKQYLDQQLYHYNYESYEVSPYCPESDNYNENISIPDLQQAKRALALIVTFNLVNIEIILKLHPDIIDCVLETRTVKITDPLTRQSFTALWHFKLSHLLACEGNSYSFYRLRELMKEKYFDKYDNQPSQFFSEPICWEAGELQGCKGPTSAFIAILYQQGKFFCDLAKEGCVLTLENGFDEPYSKINPCYLALQQASVASHFFNVMINLYSDTSSKPMIQDCVYIMLLEATTGNDAFLKILLDTHSHHIASYLIAGLFRAIEENNMAILVLISRRIGDIQFVRDKDYKSPLYIATQKALNDESYLPMVKHFLCCGYSPTVLGLPPEALVAESLTDTFTSLFHKSNSARKTIQHYFKVMESFGKVVSYCSLNNKKHLLLYKSSSHKKKPEKTLLTCANLDKEFFNELVVSFFANGEESMLNRSLSYPEDRKRYFTCLYDFMEKCDGAFYLTGETLEKIGDALIAYKKSACMDDGVEVLEKAVYFYKMAMQQTDISIKDRARVELKLQNMHEHRDLGPLYFLTRGKK